jgi:hypothetical protein
MRASDTKFLLGTQSDTGQIGIKICGSFDEDRQDSILHISIMIYHYLSTCYIMLSSTWTMVNHGEPWCFTEQWGRAWRRVWKTFAKLPRCKTEMNEGWIRMDSSHDEDVVLVYKTTLTHVELCYFVDQQYQIKACCLRIWICQEKFSMLRSEVESFMGEAGKDPKVKLYVHTWCLFWFWKKL